MDCVGIAGRVAEKYMNNALRAHNMILSPTVKEVKVHSFGLDVEVRQLEVESHQEHK